MSDKEEQVKRLARKCENFARALWLTARIVRMPWWDKDDPWCNIGLETAWEISRDIFLK